MEINITVPESLAARITAWAQMTNQDVPKVVETALDVALPPLSEQYEPLDKLSDAEILDICAIQLTPQQQSQIATLQAKQQESSLTQDEQQTLLSLMQQYHELWVRQSQALAIAVQRNLKPPLSS